MGEGSGDIRAGKAYVELYLDKSLLVKGLKGISAELRAFGAGVSAMGKHLMAAGAAIVGPLAGSAKIFADMGSELADMSARTGVSVEALSELGYAAEMSGGDLEVLEAGLRKMQKTVAEAASGTQSARDALASMGIAIGDLDNLSPDEQFMRIAKGVAGIRNPTQRAAAALEVFGKSGTKLLPMITDDLEAARQKARDLGLVMSGEDAAAADEFGDVLDTLWKSLKMGAFTIGSALAPILRETALCLIDASRSVSGWVKENKPLLVQIFQVGAAAAFAGAGIYLFGKTVSLVGGLFDGTRRILAVFGHAVDLLLFPVKIVGSAIASVLSGALSVARGAFSAVCSVISGGFTAALWGLKTALGVVTVGFHAMTSAVTIGINAFTAAVSVVATLISFGPIAVFAAILAAVGGFLLLEASARKATVAVKGGLASAVDGSARRLASGMTKGAAVVEKLRDGAVAWAGSIRSFATNVAETARLVFQRLSVDAKAGFDHLVNDIGGSWNTLQTLLATGNFAEAFALSLSIVKLEWVRFRNWLAELWEGMTPTINVAVSNAAVAIGGVLTDLKIGWGDMWDALAAGLRVFTAGLQETLDAVYASVGQIRQWHSDLLTVTLPGKGRTESFAKHFAEAEEEQKRRPGESKEGYAKRMAALEEEAKDHYVPWLESKESLGGNRQAEAIARAREKRDIARDATAPNFTGLVPGPRSAAQKAADDAAARRQGEAVAKAVKDAALIATQTPAERAAAKEDREDEVIRAGHDLEAAKGVAAMAAAEAEAKRKEAMKDMLPGGKDMALQFAGGGARSVGTFSATAVEGLGGKNPVRELHNTTKEKMNKLIAVHERVEAAMKKLGLEAAP